MRPLAFVLPAVISITSVVARPEILYTSSVTYCAPPDQLIVQEFDVTYFRANSSIKFSISATSFFTDLNATANVLINAYGDKPLELIFDFCSVLDGVLCPLPQYNFTGSAVLPLPPTFQLDIPGVAFRIPDLEAVAQLNLTRKDTGEVAACVQSTLSNGWSTHQPAVSSSTAAFTVIALVSSFFHSFFLPATSSAVFRVLDLVLFTQHIVATGSLHLNYPSVYVSFITNFAWSFGLFTDSSTLQNAIRRMREATGSRLPQDVQAPEEYTNRSLSPYNLKGIPGFEAFVAKNVPVVDLAEVFKGRPDVITSQTAASNISGPSKRDFITPPTIATEKDALDAGLPTLVNYLKIATGNAFMSVFFTTLFLWLVAATLIGLGFMIVRQKNDSVRKRYWERVVAFALRLTLIVYFPVLVFAFFQWTLRDSWLAILLSVITLLATLVLVFYPSFYIIKLGRNQSSRALYDPSSQDFHKLLPLETLGAYYAMWREPRYYQFAITFVIFPVLKAIFISFARHHGMVQVIALVVLELLHFGFLVVFRPGHSRKADVMNIWLNIVRLVTTGALVPFVQNPLGVSPIPRVAIGLVIAVICVIGWSTIALSLIWRLIFWSWIWAKVNVWRGKDQNNQEQSTKFEHVTSASGEDVEKQEPSRETTTVNEPLDKDEPRSTDRDSITRI